MRAGRAALTMALMIGATACARGDDIKVRPIAPGASASVLPVAERIVEARAQLALGNVALALEQFRKALRQQPDSIDAMTGLATCYDAMERFDLSRRYYEQALALTPASRPVLEALARSLTRQGSTTEAQSVRDEIARREASRPTAVQWAVDGQPVATVDPQSPTSVTIALPPAKPLGSRPVAVAENAVSVSPPRLERLSLGEVALITTGRSLWTPRTAREPLKAGSGVQLLNAARRQGLAARARARLHGNGWASIAIGDAPRTRLQSQIIYPVARRAEALRLARQLRIASLRSTARDDILVLLGRDAA